MHETLSGEPSHYLRLKGLQWMVGDWAAEGTRESGVSVQSTCDWTANESYLIRKFTVEGKQAFVHGGTEVIGWDPRLHRIRSWTFDSDGGFGESTWTHDGRHWIIVYTGTLANGDDVSAVHVVTPVDADTMTVRSKDRTIEWPAAARSAGGHAQAPPWRGRNEVPTRRAGQAAPARLAVGVTYKAATGGRASRRDHRSRLYVSGVNVNRRLWLMKASGLS